MLGQSFNSDYADGPQEALGWPALMWAGAAATPWRAGRPGSCRSRRHDKWTRSCTSSRTRGSSPWVSKAGEGQWPAQPRGDTGLLRANCGMHNAPVRAGARANTPETLRGAMEPQLSPGASLRPCAPASSAEQATDPRGHAASTGSPDPFRSRGLSTELCVEALSTESARVPGASQGCRGVFPPVET